MGERKQYSAAVSRAVLALGLLDDTGWPDEKQLACLYSLSNAPEQHYHPYTISKRDGGARKLLVPDGLLKQVQRRILQRVLEPQPVSVYATAYHKGAQLRQNGAPHLQQPLVLKLDIQDFFPSILLPDVLSACFNSQQMLPSVGMLLANLCCYQGALPQGAPTSPAISNLVLRSFDDWLGRWCAAQNIVYTRYSDDLTFSGNFDAVKVQQRVAAALADRGFLLNKNKTQRLTTQNRQIVTGVVVNDKLQVPRGYRRKLRQEIYYCQRYGAASHLAHCNPQPETPIADEQVRRYLQSLLGKVQFVLQINPDDGEFQQYHVWLQNNIHQASANR